MMNAVFLAVIQCLNYSWHL